MKHLFLLIISIAVLWPTGLAAQENCENALYDANALYERGKLEDCISRLTNCLNQLKSHDEKFEAYRLLAISNMNLQNSEKMHEYIVKMLEIRPGYQAYTASTDPAEFARAVNSYDIHTSWKFGASIGLSMFSPQVVENRQAFPAATSEYQTAPGYHITVDASYVLTPLLNLEPSIVFNGGQLKQSLQLSETVSQNYLERFNMIGFNLGLSRQLLPQMEQLSIGLGAGLAYLWSDLMFVETHNEANNSLSQTSKAGLDYRNRLQPYAGASLKYGYPLQQGDLVFRLSYDYYFLTLVNDELNKENLEFTLQSLYTNDLVRLNAFTFSIGYRFIGGYVISPKS